MDWFQAGEVPRRRTNSALLCLISSSFFCARLSRVVCTSYRPPDISKSSWESNCPVASVTASSFCCWSCVVRSVLAAGVPLTATPTIFSKCFTCSSKFRLRARRSTATLGTVVLALASAFTPTLALALAFDAFATISTVLLRLCCICHGDWTNGVVDYVLPDKL